MASRDLFMRGATGAMVQQVDGPLIPNGTKQRAWASRIVMSEEFLTATSITLPEGLPTWVPRTIKCADVDKRGSAVFAVGLGPRDFSSPLRWAMPPDAPSWPVTHLVFAQGSRLITLPTAITYPLLRIVSPQLLVIAESGVDDAENVWFINDRGDVLRQIEVGGDINHLLCTENYLTIGYGEINCLGISVYDYNGRFLWNWNDSTPPGASHIHECYAATELKDDHVAIFSYTTFTGDFELATVNLLSRTAVIDEAPREVWGAKGLSKLGNTWLFRAPYHSPDVFAWSPGSGARSLGRLPEASVHRRVWRGCPGGRFLDILVTHAELISVKPPNPM